MFRVAIVGRPNVGKSTLFNRLCGMRKAIVGDEPGITRDRIIETIRWRGKRIEILDTGGLVPEDREVMPVKIFEQVRRAIGEAHLLLLVVDGRAGVTPADEQLLPELRKAGKPIWVLVNKLDTAELEWHASAFHSFGTAAVYAVSAEHRRGVEAVLDDIAEAAGDSVDDVPKESAQEIRVAVIGRPNVGKSSIVNRLLGLDRTIVSEIPGTTRDSVDMRLVREGSVYRIIDTAGIRRKGKTDQRTEKISVLMARKNLQRADVALLLLDAEEGVTKLDAAISGYASESGCSVILVVNKWDLVAKDQDTVKEYESSIRRRIKYLSYAPILTVSALTGQRVSKLFGMIDRAWEERRQRIATALLNSLFGTDLAREWEKRNPSRKWGIRYITQVHASPPTFVVFLAGAKRLHFSTERFVANQLRKHFGFYASPIRIRQRRKAGRAKIREAGGD
jgi:GTP-binding protein